ncbi:MAG: glycosyltransferase family 2 protein [Verrucomicrobia bacterium]|nr:glycosyltransferase family 2 protein [Verrucomicrobiota bacterium]
MPVMEWLFPGLLTLQVFALGWLVGRARRGDKANAPLNNVGSPPGLPVSVIVPLKGASPALREGLKSLRGQEYPDCEILFVTENETDEAVPVIRELLRQPIAGGCRRCLHVVAGRAETCGQKNFNLLAGVRASDPQRPILVFCDGGHVAPPHWLRTLVDALAGGRAEVTTGYHYIAPERYTVAAGGRAITVGMLHSLQQIPGLAQPWGGGMALRRSLFDELDLAGYWARQVVDDVSLARLLKEKHLSVEPVRGAMVRTPLESESFSGWSHWLSRQLFFLKIYFPGVWLVGGVMGYALALLLVMNIGRSLMMGDGLAMAALGLFTLLVAWLRRFHPAPGPLGPWLMGGWAAVFVACACHARTLLTRRLVWRDIAYQVARNGSVRVTQQ